MLQLWDIYTLFTGIILLLCTIDGEIKTIRCCEEHVFVFSQMSLDTHLSLTGLDPMMVKMQMRGCSAEKLFDPVFTLLDLWRKTSEQSSNGSKYPDQCYAISAENRSKPTSSVFWLKQAVGSLMRSTFSYGVTEMRREWSSGSLRISRFPTWLILLVTSLLKIVSGVSGIVENKLLDISFLLSLDAT